MTYDLAGLYKRVQSQLASQPCTPLCELSSQLQVDRHTLEKAIRAGNGLTFRELRRNAIMDSVFQMIHANPNWAVKQISYALGYGSPRAFERFVKKVIGTTPAQLRSRPGPERNSLPRPKPSKLPKRRVILPKVA